MNMAENRSDRSHAHGRRQPGCSDHSWRPCRPPTPARRVLALMQLAASPRREEHDQI